MAEVELIVKDRRSAVLTASQLPCLSRVPTVNLTSGCAHGCLYCYSRGYSQYPGEGKVVLFANTLQKLQAELSRKKVKPAFVYFSPSTDIFQPVDAVLKLTYDVLAFLLSRRIGVAIVSKGVIPAEHMALFESHPEQVRAQIGLITLDKAILQVFEPGCAPVDVRLRQIERLIRLGIDTEVRLDPILPGLTDSPETLNRLFHALSDRGVKRVALNVLYLRPVLLWILRERIPDRRMRDALIERYIPGSKIRVCDERFSQIALPRTEREEIFARAIRLAEAHGITCHCCGCMNPDISNENCNLTGKWGLERQGTGQLDFCEDLS
jgi:DNA repair photolyase